MITFFPSRFLLYHSLTELTFDYFLFHNLPFSLLSALTPSHFTTPDPNSACLTLLYLALIDLIRQVLPGRYYLPHPKGSICPGGRRSHPGLEFT